MKTCKECKHYKRSERIGIKCCEFGLHESYCEKDKEDFAIEELKKLKAEFEEIECVRDNPYNNEIEYSVSMEELRELLDKHIAELKGNIE